MAALKNRGYGGIRGARPLPPERRGTEESGHRRDTRDRSEILALDEPTTFLDPPGQRALADLLRALPQAKIVVTHNIPFALALCQRAVFFQGGVIVADGPVGEVVERFAWDFVAAAPLPPR